MPNFTSASCLLDYVGVFFLFQNMKIQKHTKSVLLQNASLTKILCNILYRKKPTEMMKVMNFVSLRNENLLNLSRI